MKRLLLALLALALLAGCAVAQKTYAEGILITTFMLGKW